MAFCTGLHEKEGTRIPKSFHPFQETRKDATPCLAAGVRHGSYLAEATQSSPRKRRQGIGHRWSEHTLLPSGSGNLHYESVTDSDSFETASISDCSYSELSERQRKPPGISLDFGSSMDGC